MHRASFRFALALCASILMSACSAVSTSPQQGSGAHDALDVTTGFYPYEFVTSRVGGPQVEVVNLTKPGMEPHDLELTPSQVARLSQTDLVVYSRGFQPAVDVAVDQQAADRAFDVLSAVELRPGAPEPVPAEEDGPNPGESEDGNDPHVWLDPLRLDAIAAAVADELAARAPQHAAEFRMRAADLGAELRALDTEMRAGLGRCQRTQIVTSHDSFGYLASAYGLEQVSIAGLSPDDEASPKRLAEVARFAREKGVTTIFFEELVSPKVAESLAREVGAQARVLSPLEGAPDSGDYLTAMRENLASLRTALDCA